MEKKLYRDEHHKMIGGVCAGLAEYFGMDVTIVRLIFAFLLIAKGIGFIPYIILMIVLPKKPYAINDPNFKPGVDYTMPPQQPYGQPFNYVPPVKKTSNAGLIFGMVLIVLGSIFLLDNLDFIPDFDFEKLWPLVLVSVGVVLIATGKKHEPWKETDWSKKTDTTETKTADDTTGWTATEHKDDQSKNNPTIL